MAMLVFLVLFVKLRKIRLRSVGQTCDPQSAGEGYVKNRICKSYFVVSLVNCC